MDKLFEIFDKFDTSGNVVDITPFGEGHINSTFKVSVNDNGKSVIYILQKINTSLFPDVDKLMSNIKLVTDFIRDKVLSRGGDVNKECLTLIPSKNNLNYFIDDDGCAYRVYNYIKGKTFQTVENPDQFYQSAVAFGNFASLLSSFDANLLFDILPNFHDTSLRFDAFIDSVKNDKCNRAKFVKKEIDFVTDRKNYCDKIVSLLKSGKMPTRVTHNDTKLNNVMFDSDGKKCIAVIDLDTIMKGSICYDFGDSIRFGCNHSLEDEIDLNKVNFDLDLFDIYTKGYLTAIGDGITQIEKDNLAFSSILMTYECGMRFLKDYLDGDIYFHIKRENQNLDRARTQFKLVSDMEKVFSSMKDIINKY